MASFESTLRLNMLEIVNYSKSRKNRKRYSLADILGQLHSVYQLSESKPSPLEIADAIEYLKDRGLIEETMVGDVEVYYINTNGRDLLQRISEGDDTAII
ncbi:MAG: hypothetical protein ACXAE3_01770 [Candidatus Kariarchaeaceae archaeon]|jgi:hypothetical protein